MCVTIAPSEDRAGRTMVRWFKVTQITLKRKVRVPTGSSCLRTLLVRLRTPTRSRRPPGGDPLCQCATQGATLARSYHLDRLRVGGASGYHFRELSRLSACRIFCQCVRLDSAREADTRRGCAQWHGARTQGLVTRELGDSRGDTLAVPTRSQGPSITCRERAPTGFRKSVRGKSRAHGVRVQLEVASDLRNHRTIVRPRPHLGRTMVEALFRHWQPRPIQDTQPEAHWHCLAAEAHRQGPGQR
jgi:hypothetical protein